MLYRKTLAIFSEKTNKTERYEPGDVTLYCANPTMEVIGSPETDTLVTFSPLVLVTMYRYCV